MVRRILRRAVRYGYTYLNLKEPFLYELVDVLANQFHGIFPEIETSDRARAPIHRQLPLP